MNTQVFCCRCCCLNSIFFILFLSENCQMQRVYTPGPWGLNRMKMKCVSAYLLCAFGVKIKFIFPFFFLFTFSHSFMRQLTLSAEKKIFFFERKRERIVKKKKMQILHKMNEYNVFFLTVDSLYSLFLYLFVYKKNNNNKFSLMAHWNNQFLFIFFCCCLGFQNLNS